jgi:hypothetical protein
MQRKMSENSAVSFFTYDRNEVLNNKDLLNKGDSLSFHLRAGSIDGGTSQENNNVLPNS